MKKGWFGEGGSPSGRASLTMEGKIRRKEGVWEEISRRKQRLGVRA